MSDDDSSPRAPISSLRKWTIRLVVWAVLLAPLLLWPKAVGSALLALIILGAALWCFVKWKFRKFFGQLGEAIGGMAATFGPFALLDGDSKLVLAEQVKLHHPREAIGYREALRAMGFEAVGAYQMEGIDDASLSAYRQSEKHLWAIVYDYEEDCVLDVLGQKSDGSFFAATNGVSELLKENASNAPVACRKEGEPMDLVLAAEELVGSGEQVLSVGEDFSALFRAYIQARRIWLFGDRERQEQRQKALRVAFLEQSGWTALEWDQKQGRVFFVHEESELDSLAYQLMEMAGFPEEDEDVDEEDGEEHAYDRELEAIRESLSGSLRANFRGQLEARGLQEKCPFVMSLEEPVPADVYVSDTEVE